MRLSIEQIKDYQFCPMLYKYNHVLKVKPSKNSTIDKFATYCLNQTVNWFFHEKMDGRRPTLKGLRKKFGDLYIADRSMAETMFMDTSTSNRARTLEKRCVTAIHNFYEMFQSDNGVPMLINKEFELNFNGVNVSGAIPIIRETEYREVQLISIRPDILAGKNLNHMVESGRDIGIIASTVAFKRIYGDFPDINTSYGLYYKDAYQVEMSGALHHNLTNTVNQVSRAIESAIYYPVYNNQCTYCAYRNKCIREW